MKYYTTYKCPLCGTLIKYGKPKEIKPDELIERAMNDIPANGPVIMPHKCSNGNVGVALYCGLTVANTNL